MSDHSTNSTAWTKTRHPAGYSGWGCVSVYLQMPVNPKESVLGMLFPHGMIIVKGFCFFSSSRVGHYGEVLMEYNL